jgi:hypothetical protein
VSDGADIFLKLNSSGNRVIITIFLKVLVQVQQTLMLVQIMFLVARVWHLLAHLQVHNMFGVSVCDILDYTNTNQKYYCRSHYQVHDLNGSRQYCFN